MLELDSGGGFVDFLSSRPAAFEKVLDEIGIVEDGPGRKRFLEGRSGAEGAGVVAGEPRDGEAVEEWHCEDIKAEGVWLEALRWH